MLRSLDFILAIQGIRQESDNIVSVRQKDPSGGNSREWIGSDAVMSER